MAHKVSTMELEAAHALLQLQSSPRVYVVEEDSLSDDCASDAEDPLPNSMEVDAAHALLQLQGPDAAGETVDKESVTGNPVTIDHQTGIPAGYTLVITSDFSESDHSDFDDDGTDSDDSVMEGTYWTNGQGRASVPARVLGRINWATHTRAAKTLLSAVFSRRYRQFNYERIKSHRVDYTLINRKTFLAKEKRNTLTISWNTSTNQGASSRRAIQYNYRMC